MIVEELLPMSTAPRDGTEILAYHISGKNFHPVKWATVGIAHPRDIWTMRWARGTYSLHDVDFAGWVPYPTYEPKTGN